MAYEPVVIGKRYGKLTVEKKAEKKGKSRDSRWVCLCDCGKRTVAMANNLKKGNTRSCGCLTYERMTQDNPNYKHGLSSTRLRRIWTSMKTRCYNPKSNSYSGYGGRGITICDEWRSDFETFYAWAIENGYRDDLQIDRKNNDGNYEPSNCKWSNRSEQASNRRTTHLETINGETHTLAEWARISGVKVGTIAKRYHDGKRGADLIKAVR